MAMIFATLKIKKKGIAMWHYIKKAGELIGAGVGLYILWNCGVEYGYHKRDMELADISEDSNLKKEIAINKIIKEQERRIHKNGNVITIDLGDFAE